MLRYGSLFIEGSFAELQFFLFVLDFLDKTVFESKKKGIFNLYIVHGDIANLIVIQKW